MPFPRNAANALRAPGTFIPRHGEMGDRLAGEPGSGGLRGF